MKKKSHGKFFAYFGIFTVLIAVVLLGKNIFDRTEMFYKGNTNVSSNNTATPTESLPTENNSTPTETQQTPSFSNNPIDTSTPAPVNIDMAAINRCATTVIGWSYGRYTGSKDENGVEKMEYFLNKENNALLEKYNGIARLSQDNKTVFLTFDEGYENGYTAKILDTLKANGIKAVFFVTGEYVDTNPDLVRRMYAEGHIIGNHTNTHPAGGMSALTTQQFISDLQAVEKKVRDVLGVNYRMKLYRPPEGSFCERDLEIAKQLGYRTVLWSFAYSDWSSEIKATTENQKYAFGRITQSLHNGEVFLLHAVSETNATVLDKVISFIKSQGYTIELLGEN